MMHGTMNLKFCLWLSYVRPLRSVSSIEWAEFCAHSFGGMLVRRRFILSISLTCGKVPLWFFSNVTSMTWFSQGAFSFKKSKRLHQKTYVNCRWSYSHILTSICLMAGVATEMTLNTTSTVKLCQSIIVMTSQRDNTMRHDYALPVTCHSRCASHRTMHMSYRSKTYRVSQEECARLREGVPYVKVYRYNPKHLSPKLNGYGEVWNFDSCYTLVDYQIHIKIDRNMWFL